MGTLSSVRLPLLLLALLFAGGSTMALASDLPELPRKSGCLACHKVESGKLVGPPLSWIAYRYKDDKKAGKQAILEAMEKGSNRKWLDYGFMIMMPPTSKKVSAETREQLVDYILALDPVKPEKPSWMK